MISRPVDANSGTPSTNSGCAVFFRNSPAVYVQPPPHSRVTLFAWGECGVSQLWVLISSNLYTTLAHPSYAKNTLRISSASRYRRLIKRIAKNSMHPKSHR